MNYVNSFGFSIRWRTQFLEPFQSTSDNIEIIEFRTGMGETRGKVKTKFPNAQLTALDFSTEMLKNAMTKSEKHFDNNVLLLQQDILKVTICARLCAMRTLFMIYQHLNKFQAEISHCNLRILTN